MSNQVGSLKIRTGNKQPQQIPQSFEHITTTDFFKPGVIFCKKVIPGEHVKLRSTMNIKPRALAMPAELKLKHNLRAFWVPNFTTHKNWFAYRTNTPFTGDAGYMIYNYDYHTSNSAIVKLFMVDVTLHNAGWQTDANAPLQGFQFNITVFNSTGSNVNGYVGFDLSARGRLLYSILQQLGYEINWQVRVANDAQWQAPTAWKSDASTTSTVTNPELRISLRPWISLCKIMLDWYVPSQYQNSYESWLENQLDTIGYWDVSTSLTGTWFIDLATTICYDADRFNAAWKSPSGPNDNTTQLNIIDNTVNAQKDNKSKVIQDSQNIYRTPIIMQADQQATTVKALSDYILRALDAVQNFTTRNRIAGYRPVDRFLAHFGIHLDYVHTRRSQHITSSSINMYANDIVSMTQGSAATPSANFADEKDLLGGKGGVMTGKNGISFEWKADDDGWLFIISTIIPQTGYYQGIKNHCIEAGWLDSLYNPEFDNLGTTGINSAELFHSANGQNSWQPDNETWGYEPTYMAIKTGWDTLSGDFRLSDRNTGLDAMHTLREINATDINGKQVSSSFLKGDQEQYDRIFEYTLATHDHFAITALTVNDGTMPVESVAESLPITDGEGKPQKFEYGGSYMN